MGVATRNVDEIVPELVMSSAFVKSRTIDKTIMKPKDKAMVRCPIDKDLNSFMLTPPLIRELTPLYVGCADRPSA
jgi:hypothetical protein